MRPIDQAESDGAKNPLPDVSYEDVRQSFLLRLHGEHTRLAALTCALGSGAVTPASTFADLESFAHRLRGAAAVFGYPELRDAANALENAANAAVVRRALANEIWVQAAIRSLGARLGCLTGITFPADVAMARVPAS